LYCFDVRAGHRENVRGPIDQRCRQGLAAEIADVCAFLRTNFHGIHAWWLAANRVHASGCDFDVLAVASQSPKKPFCDWAPTNIPCADKKDVFHKSERAAGAFTKLKANVFKSISGDRPRWFRQSFVASRSDALRLL
jgi:hypothetical protein